MAQHFRALRGVEKIVLVAGDTFRAAAIDQLKLLGGRLGLPVVAQGPGADPGAVIFDGIASAAARGAQLVIADTAGRLHNRDALVKELAKIDRSCVRAWKTALTGKSLSWMQQRARTLLLRLRFFTAPWASIRSFSPSAIPRPRVA